MPNKYSLFAFCRGEVGQLSLHCVATFVITPSHRRRGATAALVRHKPQWHRHDRRGSVIDCGSTAENCQNREPSRWHGGNFELVQNFRSAPPVGPIGTGIAAAPSWPLWHRTRTSVAPPSLPCLRSTTAVQSRRSRLATYGDPVAVLLRLWRCYHSAATGVLRVWGCHFTLSL